MKYNISKPTPPAMPNLGKSTKNLPFLLSQTSKDMHQSLVPMLFPALGAHISGAEFMYPDRSWKEMCGMMGNLVAESGAGKGQLSGLSHPCRATGKHAEIIFPAGEKNIPNWRNIFCAFQSTKRAALIV